ncbi:hypothetical protein THOB06_210005 [Vibrio rotiferianus]|nr:hypothetical protein THOG10_210005 [Vibrio rotiferianus]CAH1575145.1 hypothetical protein THOB06_210005 [Vibrio rotiferianus]
MLHKGLQMLADFFAHLRLMILFGFLRCMRGKYHPQPIQSKDS